MDKLAIYPFLGEQKIPYEKIEHPAVFNMEQLASIHLPHPEWDAKNLFVRDDKKRNYYLITVKGDKRVDLKEFRRQHALRALSFASAEDLLAVLGLIPGAVSPLGILNDIERRVHVYLDREFAGSKIGVHPNDNTATVWLAFDDLLRIVMDNGNTVHFITLETALT